MENQTTTPDFILLAEKIESLTPLILCEWEKKVLSHLISRKKETFIILIDHMPEILRGIVNSLKLGVRDDEELARAHGFQRAVMTHFSIADVLNEFSILRETLISYLYPIGNLECVRFLHWHIDSMAKNSVLEFINTIPSESSRIKDHLEVSNKIDQTFS